jgi:hypothetical protein
MLETRKFIYNNKKREVFVLEEDDSSIKGIDIGSLDEKERKVLRETAEKIDSSKWIGEDIDEKEKAIELAKLKPMMSNFRHFKKSLITKIQDNDDDKLS